MTNPAKPTLWAEDKPTVTTIIPELAEEIGLNESLVLRQIVFWINTSNNLRDGEWWTYQSLEDMREKAFPYFSVSTLSRTVNKLVDKKLIKKSDQYNKRKNDRTQWFALDIEGCSSLKSVKLILQNEKSEPKKQESDESILQNEKTILHIEKPMLQNETTLPDYNPEYKQQKEKISTEPIKSDSQSDGDDFEAKRDLLQSAGILSTASDYEKLKVDAPDYSLDQFKRCLAKTIDRRKKDNRHKGYGYFMSLMPDIVAEDRQLAIIEAEKVPIPYHQPAQVPVSNISDSERSEALAIIEAARKGKAS